MGDDNFFLEESKLDEDALKLLKSRKVEHNKIITSLFNNFEKGFKVVQLTVVGFNKEKLKKTLIDLNPVDKAFGLFIGHPFS